VITFKSHDDLRKLPRDDPARPVMKTLVKQLIDDFNEPGQTYSAKARACATDISTPCIWVPTTTAWASSFRTQTGSTAGCGNPDDIPEPLSDIL
jgi:hypothetical protein